MALETLTASDANTYDILIIGGGPAALTAAIYGRMANMKVGFIEKDVPGGKIVNVPKVKNYPGSMDIAGADLALSMYQQATDAGAQYIFGDVTNIQQKSGYQVAFTSDGVSRFGRSCIIACGTVNKKLNIPGEKEYFSHGVSYCAVCDGSFTTSKVAAVVGNNIQAFDDAVYLSNIAKKIYLIVDIAQKEIDNKLLSLVKDIKNIEVIYDATCTAIKGSSDAVQLIELNVRGQSKTININYVFVVNGTEPNTAFLHGLGIVNKDGIIEVDEQHRTKIPGLFAAGDITRTIFRQITTATSDGTIAALTASQYVKELVK